MTANRFRVRTWSPGYLGERRMELFEFNNAVLMQSTGFIDKNGKEIFEGDLVEDEFGIELVYWNDEFGVWGIRADDLPVGWLYEYNKGMEVIGNIYSNPELMEEK